MKWKKNSNPALLLKELKKAYPTAGCSLRFSNPYELLVATVLSAQCTDERVNKVTRELFAKYPSPKELARAAQAKLEQDIRSTGFYRNKAKNLRGLAEMLNRKFGGDVPRRMDDLLDLPGVARKTANVVLGNAYGVAAGVVVDTHVSRLAFRLGFSNQKTAEKIERDLIRLVPRGDWIWFSHALIAHGRRFCTARRPRCGDCPLQRWCANPDIRCASGH